jgi:transcriptional regulator with XRE-family HTH domain
MLTKEDLIKTPEYWMENIQNELYRQVKKYLEDNGINQTQLAEKLKVTKGYVSQVLNGNFNFTLNKLIELSLAIGLAPDLEFRSFSDYIAKDQRNQYDGVFLFPAIQGVTVSADKVKRLPIEAGKLIGFKTLNVSSKPPYLKTAS